MTHTSSQVVPSDGVFSSNALADAERAAREVALAHGVKFDGLTTLAPGLFAPRFILPNGLTLLALSDSQAPVFAFQTWFDVGSRHEQPNKTGIAHLFEHLMFKGTSQHPLGFFDKEMERRGAQTNAATWVDWTFYRQSLPAIGDNFETVLALEADRMVNLALTQEMVDSEREVVKNERRQRVDDTIHGTLDELTYRTAFAQHSYRHPTIGYMEDLNAFTLEEFRAFYRAFYAPNNAVMVVVGDLVLDRIVREVVKAYGAIARQPLPEVRIPEEPVQNEVRRAHLYKPTESERMGIVFHAPPQHAPEHAALQVTAEILCGGETGRLYTELVIERELCQEVHASVTPFRDPGLFQLDFALMPGSHAKDAEPIVLEHLARLAQEGPDERELEKTKNRIEAAFLRTLLDVDGKAEQLGHFQLTTHDAGFGAIVLERLRAVGKEDVKGAVSRYLQPNTRTVVCVYPEERTTA